jgi:hypothetical protein
MFNAPLDDQSKKQMKTLYLIFLFCLAESYQGQLSLNANAYKLFNNTTSSLKLGYLTYPYVAKKLTDHQNKTYAKLGVQWVVCLKEKNAVIDTLAVQQYDKNGYIIQRDTFTWNERNKKYLAKFRYDYSLAEKKINKVYELRSMEADSFIFSKNHNVLHYNDVDILVKAVQYNFSDTSTVYWEAYPDGTQKGFKNYRSGKGLVSEGGYEYDYDNKGRVIGISEYTRRLADKEILERRQEEGSSGGVVDKYSLVGWTIELVYNDQKRSVQLFRSGQCIETYIIDKKSQVYQTYCCPLAKDEHREDYYAMQKTTTIFDNLLRTKSVNIVRGFDKNLCEKEEESFQFSNYYYNKNGLLSEIIIQDTKEKIFFRYLDKNKLELR